MAERIGSVWAVDLGTESLKALRLSNESGALEVTGFANIPHGKILTGTGVKDSEKQELIALTLRQFAQQNDVGSDDVIIAVPSQNSFVRFVNLPPVEQKRIPEIVKFEATQQIPFDINDVQWDWQLMSEPESAEAKVGIFAIKNDVAAAEIEHFSRENIQVGFVQIAPMALYNYLVYDRPELMKSDGQATVVMNIGAESTDLVVCSRTAVWQRTIPMGGNAFTKAIADTFKLSFEKAEKLKRTAPMSKYARQILQAMKPVFADLASEIQRSLGFFTGSNANTKLTRIIAFGGGTKMRGLLQYLSQSLQIPIERPDAFKQLALNPAVSAAKFHESVGDFGIVYGLGVQALGLGRIESNLLPRSMARSMAWAGKAKYFTAAACLILMVSALAVARVIIDRTSYTSKRDVRQKLQRMITEAREAESGVAAERGKISGFEAAMAKHFKLFDHRGLIPLLHAKLLSLLPNANNTPEQKELYEAFAKNDVAGIKKMGRKERKQIFVTGMSVFYTKDVETAQFGTSEFESEEETMAPGTTDDAQSAEERMLLQMLYGPGGAGGGRMVGPPGGGSRIGMPGAVSTGAPEPGFVVTIVGYSPYKNIGELMDPPGVQNQPAKWGVITRLLNLDSFFDGNSPFELYKRTDARHFELKTGDVDMGQNQPAGIGVKKTAGAGEGTMGQTILIDPMTKEVISKVAAVDEEGRRKTDRTGNIMYEVNDRWFILNLKLKWKNAPGASGASSAATSSGATTVPSGGAAAAPSAPSSSSRRSTDVEF